MIISVPFISHHESIITQPLLVDYLSAITSCTINQPSSTSIIINWVIHQPLPVVPALVVAFLSHHHQRVARSPPLKSRQARRIKQSTRTRRASSYVQLPRDGTWWWLVTMRDHDGSRWLIRHQQIFVVWSTYNLPKHVWAPIDRA